jgi:hypothetical protein
MSKHRIIPCPGCGLPFSEGRSLSQHLVWNGACKTASFTPNVVTQSIVPLFTEPPHIGVSGSEPFDHQTDFGVNDSLDLSDESLGTGSVLSEEVNIVTHPPTDVACNLQNVVSFPVAFTNAALHEVELMKLMHLIGAPNHAFQSLMSWAQNAAANKYTFQPCPQRYESQIKNLTGLVGMTSCRPTITQVSLEPDDIVLDVVVFPFATMLSSLLNCPMLNKLENLVVNPLDRFGRYVSPDGLLGEVNSGKWYQDTYDQNITDPDKQFLCPIIFAMDKTVISEISHLSVHVILFTTSIYNREVSFNVWLSLRFIEFFILIYIFFFFRLATNPCLGGH